MKYLTKLLIAVFSLGMTGLTQAEVSYYKPSSKTGASLCVVVKDDVLAHTSQILPLNIKGGMINATGAGDQTALVLKNLDYLLKKVDCSLNKLVKLNIYVAREELVAEVQQRLTQELELIAQPACTYVVTKLPDPKALVAMDAVAATESSSKLTETKVFNDAPSGFRVALLPAGRTAYISGQAVKADTVSEAAILTMKELFQTLEYLGAKPKNIVHIKAFMTPMSQANEVTEMIDGIFPEERRPPVSLVEWFSSLPIEIEMIVAMPEETPASRPAETVTYKTPTGMKASPVYSRVAIAEVSDRIYVSGITSKEPGDYSTRIHSVFNQLKTIVGEAGSDMQHLAKATYYVSEDGISSDFGKIRTEYYNPKRPPAASKATVKSVGVPNRILVLDMIAIPAK
ncbi:RidA family protein [Gimesia maris]|uniref:RidA family protein n=1 Tax=Gimesia maris TaxID=122 RepID=UPI00241E9906|nr:RidA family protein [Gimesia maris]|tara:strand:- start:51326 stop:52522 length:1197 start_codon:yes stop_codon:yes gene_type:complete